MNTIRCTVLYALLLVAGGVQAQQNCISDSSVSYITNEVKIKWDSGRRYSCAFKLNSDFVKYFDKNTPQTIDVWAGQTTNGELQNCKVWYRKSGNPDWKYWGSTGLYLTASDQTNDMPRGINGLKVKCD